MSTSTLELIELDVNLDQEIPCEKHTEVPAHFRVSHVAPACSFFVCTPCRNRIEQILKAIHMHSKYCGTNHGAACAKCESEIDPDTIRITSLD